MSKRISKRVREEAADLCQRAASNHWSRVPEANPGQCPKESVRSLACAAWRAALDGYPYGATSAWTPDEPWAEAEALLRTGWEPSNG